jgi:succinyl-diaminopimelate desuccinylase
VFTDWIESNHDAMVKSLVDLLRIRSVKGEGTEGMPFGEGPNEALEFVLHLASSMGFCVRNLNGYAGHVEFGDSEEYIAVLSHLDVVPAVSSDWTSDPFQAEIRNGYVYARGAIDDKGPALSTLWALYALKESSYVPRKKIRLIFGVDEESDWSCVDYYFRHEPMPVGGFTPDADFPLIYAEKGVATLRLRTPAELDSMTPCVIRLECGQRVNMVPDAAYCVIDCHSETAAREWEQRLQKESKSRQLDVDVSVHGSCIQLVVHGHSAHASTPDVGVNAIAGLAGLIVSAPISNSWMWRMIAAQDTRGKGLGMDCEDDITGPLTSNLGLATLDENTYAFSFNVRYPIHLDSNELIARCRSYVADKWEVDLVSNLDPHYVPTDSTIVQTLMQVYHQSTGENREPLVTGGATYARAIPNAVAFGPLFPGHLDLAHQQDECWSLQDFFKCAQIYAHAMMELSNNL